jgi:acyl-ACP thioesterase
VWLYVNIAAKALCRVPQEIAAGFPTHREDVFCPELEKLRMEPPAGNPVERDISVRYSDFDGNDHVNNTAYFDYLQTALAAGGFPPRPHTLQIQFLREITLSVAQVKVSLEQRGGTVAFSLGNQTAPFAHGLVA